MKEEHSARCLAVNLQTFLMYSSKSSILFAAAISAPAPLTAILSNTGTASGYMKWRNVVFVARAPLPAIPGTAFVASTVLITPIKLRSSRVGSAFNNRRSGSRASRPQLARTGSLR